MHSEPCSTPLASCLIDAQQTPSAGKLVRGGVTGAQLIVSVFSRPQLQAALVRMQRRGQELGREPSIMPAGKCVSTTSHLPLSEFLRCCHMYIGVSPRS